MFVLTREAWVLLRHPGNDGGSFFYGFMFLMLPLWFLLDLVMLPVVLIGLAVQRVLAK